MTETQFMIYQQILWL